MHFNEHICKLEQEAYLAEGIIVDQISYTDNSACMALLESKTSGLLAMIDEECFVPRGSDSRLLKKLVNNHSQHANFVQVSPKLRDSCFCIQHYAGDVVYEVAGFLEKNNNTLFHDIEELIGRSRNPLVQGLRKHQEPSTFNKRSTRTKKISLGGIFKHQLGLLIQQVGLTQPYYIRCIKPNTLKEGQVFDSKLVLAQLRCAGLLEVCLIRQLGYPVRRTFYQVVDRYAALLRSKEILKAPFTSTGVAGLLEGLVHQDLLDAQAYQVGSSTVFFKGDALLALERVREKALSEGVVKIQKVYRGWFDRVTYTEVRKELHTLKQLCNASFSDTQEHLLALNRCYSGLKEMLSNNGRHVDQMKVVRRLLQKLEEREWIEEMCKVALKEGNRQTLQASIQVSLGMGVEINAIPLLQQAQEALSALDEEEEILAKIMHALENRLGDELEHIYTLVTAFNIRSPAGKKVLDQAHAFSTRFALEKETLLRLEAALDSLDTQDLDKAYDEGLEVGLPLNHPVMAQVAETINKQLQKVEINKKRQEALVQKRSKQVDALKTRIQEATRLRDISKLVDARTLALELGMIEDELVEEARKLEKFLRKEREHKIKLTNAVAALNVHSRNQNMEKQSEIQLKRDIENVNKALTKAGSFSSDHEKVRALAMNTKAQGQLDVKQALELAIKNRKFEQLRAGVEEAKKLGMVDIALVYEARKLLRALGKERRKKKKNVVMFKVEVQDEALKAEDGVTGDKLVGVARQDKRYEWRNFYKLRADKMRRRGSMVNFKSLSYIGVPWTRTLLEQDNSKTSSECLSLHKSILGFCGDREVSFPATLAQSVLMGGKHHSEVGDEVYVQLMCHMTHNPNEDSLLKAWQLICLCVGCFLPSPEFKLFLVRFLAEQAYASSKDTEASPVPLSRAMFKIQKYAEYALRLLVDVSLPMGDQVRPHYRRHRGF